MHRRAFLTATAAAASAATLKIANAATVTPFGQTGVPGRSTEALPLGPLPNSVYPDPHLTWGRSGQGGRIRVTSADLQYLFGIRGLSPIA